jgi:hypothetical protein
MPDEEWITAWAYHWTMSRIHPECGNPSDQSVVADLILRQEPDEEEDEEEDEDDATKDDDGDRDDSGYSE